MAKTFDESCFNSDRVSITNGGTTATKLTEYHATITHSLIIPQDSVKEHTLTFKCVVCSDPESWSIGIHRADKQYSDGWFDDRLLSYAYFANGTVCECRELIKDATTGWKTGDILYLKYSPKIKELSLSVGDISRNRLYFLCSGFSRESAFNFVANDVIDLILTVYPIARMLKRVMKVKESAAGYKMAVCMYEKGDSVQILGYKESVSR